MSELSDEGMSSRAIAPVVGASHVTVQSDMRSSGKNLPDAPRTVKSIDGAEAQAQACRVTNRTEKDSQKGANITRTGTRPV